MSRDTLTAQAASIPTGTIVTSHPLAPRALTVRLLPFLAFFLSGASGLVFQTIWSRLLHHVFGSSSVAISSVVSAFMGGLALGAWLAGRLSDRLRRPLLAYAGAEVGIGVAGLLVPTLVDGRGFLAVVNAWLRHHLDADSGQFMLARFLCIVPILVVPTTLMGATLPLLARHLVPANADGRTASQRVGQLYAINTVGAVLGVFLAGFVLMPSVGVVATNTLAACTNFALALVIFLSGHRLRPISPPGPNEEGVDLAPAQGSASEQSKDVATPTGYVGDDGETWPDRVRITAAVVFGVSGAVALLSEVVWSRALVNTVGASVYAFSIILMTFLTGIAGGSAAASAALASREHGLLVSVAGVVLSLIAGGPIWVHGGWAAAAGSVGGAIAVVTLIRALRARELRQARAVDPEIDPDDVGSDRAGQIALVPVALSACVVAIYRDRLSGMALTVVILLSALLYGLRLGRRQPVMMLFALQVFIAGATLASDLWADELSIAFASAVAPLYDDLPNHVGTVMASMSMTAGLCVLPSAFGMGAMFPLTIRVWSRGGGRVGRDVSVVYTGNTIGSILGAWLPGFVLMPVFGMQGTLHVGIAVNLLLAAAIVLSASVRRPQTLMQQRTQRLAWAAAVVVPCLIAGLYASTGRGDQWLAWNISKMTLGAFRISLARDVLDEEAWGAPELVYHRDGLSTTVTVERWGRHYSLKNNGKVDASNGDDMPTQIMVSALPLLLHSRGPTGLDVAIVGVGSGVTVGAALQFPVRSVEAVELERAVVEASRFFADVNHLTYEQKTFPYASAPRLRIYNDDGRNFLAASERSFDVIVSEPSNPWLTGVSDLFTREHFQTSRSKLSPGGVYCQWVQLYELSPENVKVIYRTFASHFDHVMVFSAEDLSSDTILVGSDSPLTLDLERMERTMVDPRVRAELERAYVHAPQDVFARLLLASREEVMRYTQVEQHRRNGGWHAVPAADNSGPCPPARCRRRPSPINTDDNALIEFAAPRDLIGFERYKGYLRSMYAPSWPYAHFSDRLVGFGHGERAASAYAQQVMSLIAHGRKREARSVLARAHAEGAEGDLGPLRRAADMLAALEAEQPNVELKMPHVDRAQLGRDPANLVESALSDVRTAAARGAWEAAVAAMDRIPRQALVQAGPQAELLQAHLAHRAGLHERAIDTLEAVVRRAPATAIDHPELHYLLARAHDGLDHYDKAVRNMRVYVDAQEAFALAPLDPAQRADHAETDRPGISPKAFRTLPPPPP